MREFKPRKNCPPESEGLACLTRPSDFLSQGGSLYKVIRPAFPECVAMVGRYMVVDNCKAHAGGRRILRAWTLCLQSDLMAQLRRLQPALKHSRGCARHGRSSAFPPLSTASWQHARQMLPSGTQAFGCDLDFEKAPEHFLS